MQIVSDDGQQASARAVHVVQLVSMAEEEKKYCTYYIKQSSYTLSSHCWCQLAFQRNKRHPRIVATRKWAAKKYIVATVSDQVYCEILYEQISICLFFLFSIVSFANSSPLSSPDSLLHWSGVWSGQCDPHSAVGASTVWWRGSSQLHHHCQSRCWYSHQQ